MRALYLSACASALCVLLFSATQNAAPGKQTPDPTTDRPSLNEQERKEVQARVDRLQGLWRVVELRTPKNPESRRAEIGYLLVSGLCFSLELHWGWVGPDNISFEGKDFQSGTHRFVIDQAGNLESTSIIGSYFNTNGLLQWEQPGRVRRFKVSQLEQRMTWSNDDGTSFTFEYVPEPRTMSRDAFGRPLPEKKKDGAKKNE